MSGNRKKIEKKRKLRAIEILQNYSHGLSGELRDRDSTDNLKVTIIKSSIAIWKYTHRVHRKNTKLIWTRRKWKGECLDYVNPG